MTSIIENRSLLAFSTIAVIALGFGLPSVLIYLNVFHGLDIWFVGFFTLLSLAGGISAPVIITEAANEAKPKVSTDKEIERFRATAPADPGSRSRDCRRRTGAGAALHTGSWLHMIPGEGPDCTDSPGR